MAKRRLTNDLDSLQVYPNLSAAARILEVSASTLSRRDDIAVERRGDRDVAIPVAEVLRLAAIYRRRSLNDVAQALLDRARAAAPTDASRVEEEIEEFFEQQRVTDDQKEQFIVLARRLLPASVSAEIVRILEEQASELPDLIRGWPPLPES
jgi:hypothetical protein